MALEKGPQTPPAAPSVAGAPPARRRRTVWLAVAAVATLQAAGFVVYGDKVPSTTVPASTVSAQSPAAGVLAQPGTNMTIVVSAGAATASPAP